MFSINSKISLIGVLFLLQTCLVFSFANLKENGCPRQKYCRCINIAQASNQTNNLEFICDKNNLQDSDFLGFFAVLKDAYASPDEEDRQEKTAADDSTAVLTLGSSKPKFLNLNISSTQFRSLDFKQLEDIQFKSINIVNNRNLRQALVATNYNDDGGKFSFDKVVPVEVINDVTESFVIEGSPSLGQGRMEKTLFDQLGRLKALKSLTLANNRLKVVPHQAFANAVSSNLRSIDLKDNRIREVGELAFAGLPGLNRINLDGNRLVRLYGSVFAAEKPTSEIMMIFLRFNRLDENSFDDRTFEGLEDRNVFIYLTGNRITTLPESVFGSLLRRSPQKTFITLFDNPINCEDCSMRWLYDGKDRFSQKVFGPVCAHTGRLIWKLPEDFYEERCSSD